MAEKFEKKVAIIGVGNCGSQVAALAQRKYPDIFDCIYINTSEADLSMVDTSIPELKIKIGKDVEGSAKNRSKMKEYLQSDIKKLLNNETFVNILKNKRYGFIVSSAAGGTGSGATPVLMALLSKIFPDVVFVLVTVLPQMSSSLMEQGNTIEYLKELYEDLGGETTYMVYDNETASDMSPTKALEVVNENIVEDLRILSGVDNFATQYDSIDEADMESIISTPGRLMVTRVTKGLTEKNLEDACLDEIIIKSIKNSCHAETDRNKRVVMWGVITHFTEPVNKLYNADLQGVCEFIGTPVQRFNHNSINKGNENSNFLYLITSGLSPINDRTQKISDRINELKQALAADSTNKFILEGEGASYDVMAERKKISRRQGSDEGIDTNDIFARFMKK